MGRPAAPSLPAFCSSSCTPADPHKEGFHLTHGNQGAAPDLHRPELALFDQVENVGPPDAQGLGYVFNAVGQGVRLRLGLGNRSQRVGLWFRVSHEPSRPLGTVPALDEVSRLSIVQKIGPIILFLNILHFLPFLPE